MLLFSAMCSPQCRRLVRISSMFLRNSSKSFTSSFTNFPGVPVKFHNQNKCINFKFIDALVCVIVRVKNSLFINQATKSFQSQFTMLLSKNLQKICSIQSNHMYISKFLLLTFSLYALVALYIFTCTESVRLYVSGKEPAPTYLPDLR